MAEEQGSQDNNGDASSAEKKKLDLSKFKLPGLILAVVLLVGGAIGGTLYFLGVFEGGDDTEQLAEEDEAPAEEGGEAEVDKAPAMYFPIKPAFVVNYSSRNTLSGNTTNESYTNASEGSGDLSNIEF